MSENRTEKLPFIDWLRCCSMLSIVACHLVQVAGGNLAFLTQVFNLGVQVFFLVSGFSLGLQGEIVKVGNWYNRRFKKIFIPYLFFVAVLFIVYCFKPYYFDQVTPEILFMTILGMQGFSMRLLGATHTWFITSILIFYAVLPAYSKIWFLIRHKKNNRIITVLFLIAAFVATYLILEKYMAVVVAPVFMSLIAYTVAVESKGDLELRGKRILIFVFVVIGCLGRASCLYIQNEKLGSLLVGSSTFIIAFAIFMLFSIMFKGDKANGFVRFMTGISFEVYLFHYMFIEGPIYLMYRPNGLISNIVITVSAVFVSAILANKVVTFLNNKIFSKKKGIDT